MPLYTKLEYDRSVTAIAFDNVLSIRRAVWSVVAQRVPFLLLGFVLQSLLSRLDLQLCLNVKNGSSLIHVRWHLW